MNMRLALNRLLAISFFLVPLFLLGQETVEDQAEGADASRYVIGEVDYTIEGITRKSVLVHYLEIEKGTEFLSEEELKNYFTDKEQLLKNQRTLAEGRIDLSYREDPEEPSRSIVDVSVYVRDTWNLIVLPYASYDSNDGMLFSLRGRNYNFFGGMEELSIDLDYLRTVDDKNEYSVVSEFGVPFFWQGYEWLFDFKEDLSYTVNDPLRLKAKGGLSVDIPTRFHTWQAELSQEYNLNKDYEDEDEPDPDTYYFVTGARIGASIPTGIDPPLLKNGLEYNPGFFTKYPYKPGDTLSYERRGYKLGFDHELTGGRIDWHGNYRHGIEVSLDHSQAYNFENEYWEVGVNFTGEFHRAFGWAGLSSRFKGFYLQNDVKDDVGSDLRGILDKRIEGDAGVTANLALPFNMWMWFLSDWFEGHISPFLDYALVRPVDGEFNIDDSWYGVGIEALGYPKFARSIYIRISVGIDLEAMLEGGTLGDPAPRDDKSRYEIYIGLGHHY